MRQLSDILKEKSDLVGGKAALGRLLGGLTGQAIGQYMQGGMPSLTMAIHWKNAFNENLIDLMFADQPAVVEEPETKYETLKDKYINALEQLNVCRLERDRFKDELEELKKFGHTTGTEQLKEPPKEPVTAK